MKLNLIKFVALSCFVIINFLPAGSLFAQDNTNQTAPKKVKTSYLQDITRGLPEGVEKDFLLELEKRESEHLDLIEAFNLFQYKDLQPFGTVQLPGKEPEILYLDLGGSWAMTYRPKLRWEKTIINSNDSFRLLFFQVTPPNQFRPTCDAIIVIADTNYKIRFWTKAGCYENFIKASIEKVEDGFIFKVFSNLYQEEKDLRIQRYKITLNKIIEINQQLNSEMKR